MNDTIYQRLNRVAGRAAGFSFVWTLLAGFLAVSATAQTFAPVYDFSATVGTNGGYGTNGDGAYPSAGLAASGNTLYGTAQYGGRYGTGSVFAVNTDGTGFRTLHNFTAETPDSDGYLVNLDGAYPYGGLVLADGVLYGTAAYGGTSGAGTVFKINTNGTGFGVLKDFYNYNDDGGFPEATLSLANGELYGTTYGGGTFYEGTIFRINTNGLGYAVLHSFSAVNSTSYTNVDGANPQAALTVSGNTLYGVAQNGGDFAGGTLFRATIGGENFTVLHHFTTAYYDVYSGFFENADGIYPLGQLLLSGTNLYGTANQGGGGGGTVFLVSTNGTGFTTLYEFFDGSDGGFLNDGVVLSGNMLYGTTAASGDGYGYGTLFGINLATNASVPLTNLYSFTGRSDGATPLAGLTLTGGALYGTAEVGGSSGHGTVFSFSLPQPPPLAISASETNLILTWPTNATGYVLQCARDIGSPSSWSTNLPPSVIVESNTATIPFSVPQMFFRLAQ